jgi:hypothetical protein
VVLHADVNGAVVRDRQALRLARQANLALDLPVVAEHANRLVAGDVDPALRVDRDRAGLVQARPDSRTRLRIENQVRVDLGQPTQVVGICLAQPAARLAGRVKLENGHHRRDDGRYDQHDDKPVTADSP